VGEFIIQILHSFSLMKSLHCWLWDRLKCELEYLGGVQKLTKLKAVRLIWPQRRRRNRLKLTMTSFSSSKRESKWKIENIFSKPTPSALLVRNIGHSHSSTLSHVNQPLIEKVKWLSECDDDYEMQAVKLSIGSSTTDSLSTEKKQNTLEIK
jgi:hypothetical protein